MLVYLLWQEKCPMIWKLNTIVQHKDGVAAAKLCGVRTSGIASVAL